MVDDKQKPTHPEEHIIADERDDRPSEVVQQKLLGIVGRESLGVSVMHTGRMVRR